MNEQEMKVWHGKLEQLVRETSKYIVGQEEVIRHMVAAMIAGGHVLLEDVPGTGKTTLALTLAKGLGLDFKRLQCTPDLLPADVVGTFVYHPEQREFAFRSGPIFTQLLLVDEINRAVPRMQSALLEAMQEGKVTIEGQTMSLPTPFIVLATANPLESQGVFPLPEAQLDRFLVQLHMGYLSEEREQEMIRRIRLDQSAEITTILQPNEIDVIKDFVKKIEVTTDLLAYIVRLGRSTRENDRILVGASPRAILALTSYAQALALLYGRTFVIPDDVKEAFYPVMNHRLIYRQDYRLEGEAEAKKALFDELIGNVPVPVEQVEV